MVMKIHMEKAFHRMEWSYLLHIFNLLGLHPIVIQQVAQCIFAPTFSILLNGSPIGFFPPTRASQQGDPFCLTFFIIGMEAEPRYLLEEEEMRRHKISRQAAFINHMFFADDPILLSKANQMNALAINTFLKDFMRWPSQGKIFHLFQQKPQNLDFS